MYAAWLLPLPRLPPAHCCWLASTRLASPSPPSARRVSLVPIQQSNPLLMSHPRTGTSHGLPARSRDFVLHPRGSDGPRMKGDCSRPTDTDLDAGATKDKTHRYGHLDLIAIHSIVGTTMDSALQDAIRSGKKLKSVYGLDELVEITLGWPLTVLHPTIRSSLPEQRPRRMTVQHQ